MAFTVAWFAFPPQPDRGRADAVVVLAGGPGRLDHGVALVEQGLAPRMYLSNPRGPTSKPEWAMCHGDEAPRGVEVTCFPPHPETTVGEALTFAKLAEARGVRDVVVVTNRPHARRAHEVFSQCTNLDVRVAHTPSFEPEVLVRHILREIGGTLKYRLGAPCE